MSDKTLIKLSEVLLGKEIATKSYLKKNIQLSVIIYYLSLLFFTDSYEMH